MTLLVALIVAAPAHNGLLSGISFDGALVKLPTRRRIGSVTKPSCRRCWIASRIGWSSSTTAWGNAVSTWNGSAANYYLTNNQSSLNKVADTYNSSVTWDGNTYMYYLTCSPSCVFSSFGSYLNTYFTENHDPCGNFLTHDCYTELSALTVAAHELGHVAGLAHTSSCVLMNPYTWGSGGRFTSDCGYINVPKSDDINGVNAQY